MAAVSSLRAAAVAVSVALLLGACAAATADQGNQPDQGAGTGGPANAGDFGPDGPDPSDRPDPALSGLPVPTVPPGDPGAGSGDPDDPGSDGDHDGDHDGGDGAPASVPEAAIVDLETVGALVGGSWSPDLSPVRECAAGAPGATASRSYALTAADGRLVQTVSAHPGVRAARAAVPATADQLAACGFTPAGDPRLGEASAELTRRSADGVEQVAVVLAAEGVTVILVATGSAAVAGVWEALADVALGTSCAAAADGCH